MFRWNDTIKAWESSIKHKCFYCKNTENLHICSATYNILVDLEAYYRKRNMVTKTVNWKPCVVCHKCLSTAAGKPTCCPLKFTAAYNNHFRLEAMEDVKK